MKAGTTKLASDRCLGLLPLRGVWQRLSVSLMLVMLTTMTAWATEISEIEIPSNTGNIWTALLESSATTVTTSNGVTTITLNACIKTSETLQIGGSDGAYILDLNGYGIRYTGDEGNVIFCANLTLKDSRPTATTYYITLTNGRGTSVADSGTASATCLAVTGGYITGGNAVYGGGVYTPLPFTMTGGTICGNKANSAGGVAAMKFTMSGGAIINNISLESKLENNAYISGHDGYCRIHKDLTFSDEIYVEGFNIKRFGYSVTIKSASNATVTASEGEVEIVGTRYYLEGQTVTLSDLPTKAGWLDWHYTVTKTADGTDITATALSGITLTMPSYDVTVTLTATPDPTHFSVSGDEYTIKSATGWDIFCDALQDNDTYNRFSGKTVKLGNDITVSRMAGSSNHDFCGTFDGQGHTLTFNYGTAESPYTAEYVAPFCYVSNTKADPNGESDSPAAFRNLHVCGDIYTSAKYAAGLIAREWGTVSITNCCSSVNIHSSVSGDGTHGGFVSGINNGALTIEGCLFNGSLLGETTTCCGGFVGWRGGAANIYNSLFDPAEVSVSSEGSATFARNGVSSISNSYYATAFGTSQGKAARKITSKWDDIIERIAFASTYTDYTVSRIMAMNSGGIRTYDSQYYYGNGDIIIVYLNYDFPEAPAGYRYEYIFSSGTAEYDPNDTSSGACYILTMPDEDVTVSPGDLVPIDWTTMSTGDDADHAYMIYNKDQLDLLAQRVNSGTGDDYAATGYEGKYFKLGADITYPHATAWNDASSEENNYTAIGRISYAFRGTFDGQGHTISGIRIYKGGTNTTDFEQGLFGGTYDGATIRGIILTDARITGYDDTGGIVGSNSGTTIVSDCHVAADVTIHAVQSNADNHGGIVGHNGDHATVSDCTSAATPHQDW